MLKIVKKSFSYGNTEITIETGRIARQATGAALITAGGTQILCTVAADASDTQESFFPLSVFYQERFYAVGKIPGGYLKREGRPSERETLISRLIDRSLRPLFPSSFRNTVQVMCTVLSADDTYNTDIIASLGASAALAVSGLPVKHLVASARVGYDPTADQYMMNPKAAERENSILDMVVSGTQKAVLMVESQAEELPEEKVLAAINYAHAEMQTAIEVLNAMRDEVGKTSWKLPAEQVIPELPAAIREKVMGELEEVRAMDNKQARSECLKQLKQSVVAKLIETEAFDESLAEIAFAQLHKQTVRRTILASKDGRIESRSHDETRQLTVDIDVLTAAHGSSLFTRGETQALVTCTFGGVRDVQNIDSLEGFSKQHFMLHYNFPSYSVGECGRVGPISRREIGHGTLARKGLQAALPTQEEFPYTVRVVSEITESNGSSSMATVCGTSLALMAAGVPMKSAVAGVAMGLIVDEDKYAILTDISGEEDHLGDMDFKVVGTDAGVTALQMDIKIDGITSEIMEKALEQAKHARKHILNAMNDKIAQSRSELPQHAPRILICKIPTSKIPEVIGKGGAVIRGIIESTQSEIDISEDGVVRIFAADQEKALSAQRLIMEDIEVGKVYTGTVVRIVAFGAFVSVLPGKEGLLHISQIADRRIEAVSDYLSEGQSVQVKVIGLDAGRIKLSMRDIEQLKAPA